MITVLALALVAAAMVVVPLIISRGSARAVSPRLRAVPHLVNLAGVALLPVSAAVCAGLRLASVVTRVPALTPGCGAGAGTGWWSLLPAGLALGTLAPLAWQAGRIIRAARRTELDGMALAGATPRQLRDGGVVWVVPAGEPAAYACGLRHPRAVVTSGLLALLDPAEQQAVCEHEGAHLRLGHPRLLLAAAVVARAYRFLSPVRHAWSGLRREVEAAADDEAVRAVGTGAVLSALARAGLARSGAPGTAAGFGDPDDLRYRIARLQQPRATARGAAAVVSLGGVTLITAFAVAACGLATGTATGWGLTACATALAATGLRPLWSAGRRNRSGIPAAR